MLADLAPAKIHIANQIRRAMFSLHLQILFRNRVQKLRLKKAHRNYVIATFFRRDHSDVIYAGRAHLTLFVSE